MKINFRLSLLIVAAFAGVAVAVPPSTYRNAIILGGGAVDATTAVSGASDATHYIYWNSADGRAHVVNKDTSTEFAIPQTAVATGGGYATMAYETTPLAQQATVNWSGPGLKCANNSGASRTDCKITPLGYVDATDLAYGADKFGVIDSTTAIKAAVTAAGPYAIIYLPPGTYLTSDTITLGTNYQHVSGAGAGATRIMFQPTTNGKAAIKYTGGSNEQAGGSVSGIALESTDTTHMKIGIEVDDGDEFYAQDVWVGASIGWAGNGSEAFRLRGRQQQTWSRIRGFADLPMHVMSDPNITSPVNCDHLHLSDTYFAAADGYYNMLIDDSIVVTNLTIDGENGWDLGLGGLYWKTTTNDTTDSENIHLSGIRYERPTASTGWGIYIERSGSALELQNLLIEDVSVDGGANGIYLSNVKNATLISNHFGATSGSQTSLDVSGGNVYDLTLLGNYVAAGGAVHFGTMICTLATPVWNVSQNMPSTTFCSDSSTGGARGLKLSPKVTVLNQNLSCASCQLQIGTDGATTNVALGNSGGVFLGGTIEPATNNAVFNGTSGNSWEYVYSYRYNTHPQVIAAASSITIFPGNGLKIRINENHSTTISSLTFNAGNDGDEATVCAAQDSTGGAGLIPSTWTNVRFGGTYTPTAIANKIDCFHFVYDGTAAAWLENGRGIGL